MATIDQLVVSLVLDSTGFNKGSAEAVTALSKTKEAATKAGTDIEAAGKQAAAGISRIAAEILGLYAIMAGTGSIKDFIRNVVDTDAAVSRVAATLDTSVESLSNWQGAAKLLGGSASGITNSMASLRNQLDQFRFSGDSPLVKWFSAMHIDTVDAKGRIKDMGQLFLEMAKWSEGRDSATAASWLRNIVPDESTVQSLIKGQKAWLDALAESRTHGVITPEDSDAANKLLHSIEGLGQAATNFGQKLITDLSPYLTDAIDQMTKWVDKNKGWLDQKIGEKVKEFGAWLEGIDWPGVQKGIKDFISGAKDLGSEFDTLSKKLTGQDGMKTAFELFGVMLLARVVAPLATIVGLLTTLGGMSLPAWLTAGTLAKLLGDNTKNEFSDLYDMTAGEAALRFLDPGLADRVYGKRGEQLLHGPHHGLGVKASPKDNRTLFRKGYDKVKGWLGFGDKDTPATTGVPYEGTSLTGAMGATDAQYNAFKEGLTDIEGKRYDRMGGAGGHYAGRYQMGAAEITETAARLGVPRPTNEQFLADPQMQERFFENYTLDHFNQLMRNPKFAAMTTREKFQMLGYAHNQGVGGANTYLSTGQTGSDAFGTKGTAYFGTIGKRLDAAAALPPPVVPATPVTNTPYGSLSKALKDFRTAPGVMPIQPNAFLTIGSAAAAANAYSAYNNSTTNAPSTSSSQTSIGTIVVHSNATDTQGIARDLGPHLKRGDFVSQQNGGPV